MKRLPTRDDCPTCNERRDELGRLPTGFCGDDCLMAKEKNRVAAMQDLDEHRRRGCCRRARR